MTKESLKKFLCWFVDLMDFGKPSRQSNPKDEAIFALSIVLGSALICAIVYCAKVHCVLLPCGVFYTP